MACIRWYEGAGQLSMPDAKMPVGTHLIVADVPGVWFLVHSQVTVIADCRQGGVLVSGRLADGREDEELCAWEEFLDPGRQLPQERTGVH